MNGKGETTDFQLPVIFLPLTMRHFNAKGASLESYRGRNTFKMGVIGRLDDQVNEIIIKPVGAKKRQEGDEQTQEDDPQKSAPPQAEAQEDRAQNKADGEAGTETELPVWLL